ncbi:competence type IV pilus minor pilin ComGG [Halalkalibacter akibai]|uniref:competence type IV pilus minor pilin ComGG n=1 Tax=Halalkalibacter akibai TaxID=1411 RepID=UPI00130DEB3D|nr:competence type IV pilus minor pilin ComGG [Halalkalibacter akibai]
MNNERGFVYPATIAVCLLIVHLLLLQISYYQTEKQFLYHQEKYLTLESILQVSITEFKKQQHTPRVNYSTTFAYDIGTVTFTIRSLQEGSSQIHVKARLSNGYERIAGFDFNWSSSKISNYWEGVNSMSYHDQWRRSETPA